MNREPMEGGAHRKLSRGNVGEGILCVAGSSSATPTYPKSQTGHSSWFLSRLSGSQRRARGRED